MSKTGIDNVSWEVNDGESLLVLTFSGFHAGEKLVFRIDVDEVEKFKPSDINSGLDPVASEKKNTLKEGMILLETGSGRQDTFPGVTEFRFTSDSRTTGRGYYLDSVSIVSIIPWTTRRTTQIGSIPGN